MRIITCIVFGIVFIYAYVSVLNSNPTVASGDVNSTEVGRYQAFVSDFRVIRVDTVTGEVIVKKVGYLGDGEERVLWR